MHPPDTNLRPGRSDDPSIDIGPTATIARAEEKVTVNLSPIDVGLLDLLAQAGFVRSRSSIIRRAISAELARNERHIERLLSHHRLRLDSQAFDAERLIDLIDCGDQLDLNIVGRLVFTEDVAAHLAERAIRSARVVGVVRGPKEVLEAIRLRRAL